MHTEYPCDFPYESSTDSSKYPPSDNLDKIPVQTCDDQVQYELGSNTGGPLPGVSASPANGVNIHLKRNPPKIESDVWEKYNKEFSEMNKAE